MDERDVRRASRGARPHMSLDDRAKIFVPFDPLDGFREALRAKELESEEAAEAHAAFERGGGELATWMYVGDQQIGPWEGAGAGHVPDEDLGA